MLEPSKSKVEFENQRLVNFWFKFSQIPQWNCSSSNSGGEERFMNYSNAASSVVTSSELQFKIQQKKI